MRVQRCRPLPNSSSFHYHCRLEDYLKFKEEQKTVKAKQIVQKKGKSALDQLCIPIAKFESDLALLRGADPQHPLLPQLDQIFEKGNQLKKMATIAMQDGSSPTPSSDTLKNFLADLRTNSKAAAAFAKPEVGTKSKAAAKGGA